MLVLVLLIESIKSRPVSFLDKGLMQGLELGDFLLMQFIPLLNYFILLLDLCHIFSQVNDLLIQLFQTTHKIPLVLFFLLLNLLLFLLLIVDKNFRVGLGWEAGEVVYFELVLLEGSRVDVLLVDLVGE